MMGTSSIIGAAAPQPGVCVCVCVERRRGLGTGGGRERSPMVLEPWVGTSSQDRYLVRLSRRPRIIYASKNLTPHPARAPPWDAEPPLPRDRAFLQCQNRW